MYKIIISLTSYPRRINIVNQVIKSLWNQSVCADEIILYLSQQEFPRREKDIPADLVEMEGKNGFKIEWVEENLKSHKKYYYVLQSKKDDIVITVDDDKIYAKTLIDDLICSYKRFPRAISARGARTIVKDNGKLAEYKDWEECLDVYADMPRMDLCAIGAGGILYPPSCAQERWFHAESIRMLAEDQDDLWLKYNEIIDYIPVVYTRSTQSDTQIENTEDDALCVNNLYGGENDSCIEKLSAWISKNRAEVYKEWFTCLMQKEEFIVNKKASYSKYIKQLFDEQEGVPIYIYGAGKRAKFIINILNDLGMLDRVDGIIVSDKSGNPDVLESLIVKQLEEVDKNMTFVVIYGVAENFKSEIDGLLKDYNCKLLDLNIQTLLPYYKC